MNLVRSENPEASRQWQRIDGHDVIRPTTQGIILTLAYWIFVESIVTFVKSAIDGGLPPYWFILAPLTIFAALFLTYPLYCVIGLISRLSTLKQALIGSLMVILIAGLLRISIEALTSALAGEAFGLDHLWTGKFARDLSVQTGFLAPISFWFISLRHHQLQLKQAMAEAHAKQQVVEARLAALRYQVNPHFLFNTLNSISTLVLSGEANNAEQMLMKLSSFFRSSLETDVFEDIPLEREIHLQRLYLDIESVRFPDELHYRFDIEPEAYHALVPSLILQPLVENAIKYGIKAAGHTLNILVSARRSNGRLSLTVKDDGRGVPGKKGGTGVGLKNVKERLAIRYGGEYTFDARRSDEGYCVRMTLPWNDASRRSGAQLTLQP